MVFRIAQSSRSPNIIVPIDYFLKFATFRDIICAEDMNAEICNSSTAPSTAPVVGPAICKDSELQFWANWTDRLVKYAVSSYAMNVFQ